MINRAGTMEALLTQLEDEVLASTDEDILAGPSAMDVSRRVGSIIECRLRPRLDGSVLPARVPGRRDRRGRGQEREHQTKRQLVDRVLVASSKARALVGADMVAVMSEDELDHFLARMRALGLLSGLE